MDSLNRFVIEMGDEAMGVAFVEQDGGLLFLATHPATTELDRHRFNDAVEARRACAAALLRVR